MATPIIVQPTKPSAVVVGGASSRTPVTINTDLDYTHVQLMIDRSMYKGVPVVSQTTDATIAPNVWNVWGEVTSLTITKGTDIDGIVNNYMVRFTALEGATITFDGFSLSWFGGEAPTWTACKTYEISIVDNIALWAEIEPAA